MKNPAQPLSERTAPRLALFSDAHLFEDDDPLRAILPGKQVLGERLIAKHMKGTRMKLRMAFQSLREIGGADHIFFGGDMISDHGERGIIGPESPEHIADLKKLIHQYFGNTPHRFMAGGHELGYKAHLSSDPQGGISDESIAAFEENFDALYYDFEIGNRKFVVVSSDLELLNESEGTEKMIQRKKEQSEFYRDSMSSKLPDQKLVLMTHDPDALVPMYPFLKERRDQIEKVFCGHMHAQSAIAGSLSSQRKITMPVVGWGIRRIIEFLFPGKSQALYEYAKKSIRDDKAAIWKDMQPIVIPASCGLMGKEAGYMTADLKEEGIDVQRHYLL